MRRIVLIALGLLAAALLVAIPATGADEGTYRVRAVFDNGSFLVKDEEVRVAGANVGIVESVDVSGDDEIVSNEDGGAAIPGKAVVVLRIEDDGFKDFREDASCLIRPQSLIGERFVDCKPTQPRRAGEEPPPELEEIPDGEPGEGQRLLPLENNGKSIDLDLLQNINRAPYRDRFRLILNDLGAGVAARGDDLGEIIDRANPALRQTDRVVKILADQSDRLADLATNGDTVLEPLARNRENITGFITNARIAGEATAERSEDLEAQFQKLPETLRQVRLTMTDLKRFADQGTPLMQDIGLEADDLSRATQKLTPFAKAAVPAFRTLGDAAEASGPKLVASDPVIVDLRELGKKSGPSAQNLSALLDTFARTKGFEYLMDFIYYSSASINGFDEFGHFLRAQVNLTSCLEFRAEVFSGCEALFIHTAKAAKKKKKKKKSKKSTALIAPAEPEAAAPQAPAEPLPPVEELIPELQPEDGDQAPADPGQDPTEGDEADPGSDADATGTTTVSQRSAGGQPITVSDASMFLRFLLGGGG